MHMLCNMYHLCKCVAFFKECLLSGRLLLVGNINTTVSFFVRSDDSIGDIMLINIVEGYDLHLHYY